MSVEGLCSFASIHVKSSQVAFNKTSHNHTRTGVTITADINENKSIEKHHSLTVQE